ncbi:phosphatase PAP2 family protein [Brevundimonas sp.]|uniref:acid phosphatase n=1 Tax=Brevundimonas sp. TaxID=1871086 RepID=UPI00289EE564|nr:phosphatase PAP2 family protein [Brevundimonas sp.]
MRITLVTKAVAALVVAVGCASAAQQPGGSPIQATTPEQEAQIRAILAAAYLPQGGAPDSLTILPAPPAFGSPGQARDDASAAAAQGQQGTPRWSLATRDADLSLPNAARAFTCALGVEISEAGTPRTYNLLRRSMADVGLSTYPTKTKYQRTRPFVVTSTPTCTPAEEDFLRHDGSYPSGRSAIGWGWALVLTQVAPERQNEILARGRAFGQSRVVCNVHWLSDTEEGRLMASATVARLQSAPEFRADVEAARSEIATARTAQAAPASDCASEAAALAA